MRLCNVVGLALLALGRTALAATCTVTPGMSTAAARRAVEEELVGGPASPSPSTPLAVREVYPRPEPGTDDARRWERRALPDPDDWNRTPYDSDISFAPSAADDTPAILDAFKRCGHDGTIILEEGTYNIRQVMNTSDLRNCDIHIYGKLVWSADNIQYWLSRSFGVTYAGRSTAWLLGGTNISMRGYGKALFDGNGQIWIDQNKNNGNQNGRPISLTIWHGTNVFIDGFTWRMAQFWHTFIAHSQNVTMTNLDMKSLSNSTWKAVNTDGTDTWNSRDVYIANWTVACGDDCISVKGNSTNIHMENVVCQESGCACVGSMSNGVTEFVDNVWFENITCKHSSNAAWIKTYPGSGHVRNVTFKNIKVEDVDQPIYVTPCIYSGNGCDSSRVTISDITWINVTGKARYNVAAGIHCSAAAPCQNLKFEGIDIKASDGGPAKILCSNFNEATSGLKCTGTCPGNWPQQLKGNR